MGQLYCGENLDVVRERIPSGSVHLVYLDPPFHSQRAYRLRQGGARGKSVSQAVTAFDDLWRWDDVADGAYRRMIAGAPEGVARVVTGLHAMVGESGLMAYLVMIGERLVELHRVLAPEGSLYLHCDPSASHYLKVLMDGLFGPEQFRNEIVWHYYNKYSAGKRIFPRSYDQLLFYSKTGAYTFEPLREPRERPARQLLRVNVGGVLKNRKDAQGRTMTRLVPDRKVDAVWRIPCLQYASRDFLGFPTQKPLPLLERIIAASSRPGDTVLDPFCGSGTTLHAAEKLGRAWIGVDCAPLAVALTEQRLARAFSGAEISLTTLPQPRTVSRARSAS